VWLDTHIGRLDSYNDLKAKFRFMVNVISTLSSHIDELICAWNTTVTQIEFFDTPDAALFDIKSHNNQRTILISSGSLGKRVIPYIVSTYSHVYSFYILCGCISNHVHWVLDYYSCIQIFDHEIDLLIRLVRDISHDIIKLGMTYLVLEDSTNALKCFEKAHTLETRANTTDQLNDPFYAHLRILDGHKSEPGLIQEALIMCQQQ
jgi:hypothetical protein